MLASPVMGGIDTAKKTLSRAFAELEQAQGDPEKMRQAAEKGWRAAREAVYAVMACKGERPGKRTVSADEVAEFETHKLGRPRGRHPGQPLTDGYLRAMEFLHGGCFYEDKCPHDVKGELREVNLLLEQAEKDASRCVVPRRKRQR